MNAKIIIVEKQIASISRLYWKLSNKTSVIVTIRSELWNVPSYNYANSVIQAKSSRKESRKTSQAVCRYSSVRTAKENLQRILDFRTDSLMMA